MKVPVIIPVPGIGFTKPECGAWVRKLKSGDLVRDIYHNCDRLSCPACMPGALDKKGRDAGERFDNYERLILLENTILIPGETRGKKPRHFGFTISPAKQAEYEARVRRKIRGPWGEAHHIEFLDIFREDLQRILKTSGLVGGMVVYHPYRVRHPLTGATGARAKTLIVREAKLAGDMDDEDPEWKLYDHIRKQKNWAQYYYFSPHFHIIAYGIIQDVKEFEDENPGWKYHNKNIVSSPGGLARYLFSHQALFENGERRSVSWFGRISPAVMGKDEIRTVRKPVICEETKLPWIIIESTRVEEIGAKYCEDITEWKHYFREHRKRGPPDPDKIVFPRTGKRRRASPFGIYEKGIDAMAAYCDEWGHL
jgi:hypothetical protein